MKTIALIGAKGFIGKNLLPHLKDFNVVSMDRADFDLTDAEKMNKAFEKSKPHIVINLSAYKKRGSTHNDFREAIQSNLLGTLNIIDAAEKCKSVEHMIFLGSAEEYGMNHAPFTEGQTERPVSAYSYSKTCSKILLQTLFRLGNVPYTYIRPTLVYGPGQGEEMFLSSLIADLKNKKRFPLTKGEQLRDFLHVDDLSEAILEIIKSGNKTFGKVYNVGGGEEKTIKDIALIVADKMNCRDLLDIGAIPYREAEIFDYRSSCEKISQDIGWKPRISLEIGLAELIDNNTASI